MGEQATRDVAMQLASSADGKEMKAVATGIIKRPTTEYTSLDDMVTAVKATALINGEQEQQHSRSLSPPVSHQQASHGQLVQNCMGTVKDPLRTPPHTTSATPTAEDMQQYGKPTS